MPPAESATLSLGRVAFDLPDGRTLFHGVDLQLNPGDAVAIAAPSGSGKSTLLAILGGLLQPSSGNVRLDPNATFAWIPQTLNALPARSTLDNAALLAVLDGKSRAQARSKARSVLSDLGLQQQTGNRGRTLSGGELQRTVAARAITSDRPIILADEPTNQLDHATAVKVMARLIDSATTDGRIVVIVTHDIDALPSGSTILHLDVNGLRTLTPARP